MFPFDTLIAEGLIFKKLKNKLLWISESYFCTPEE